jgi:guanyl-specific ribonuclease Sa
MGYSTVIGLGILLAAAILVAVWIRRGQAQAADAATTRAVAAGNEAVSDANKAAADSRATDRGPTPGVLVRDRQKPTGDL